MWRKPAEAKPSSQALKEPEPAPFHPPAALPAAAPAGTFSAPTAAPLPAGTGISKIGSGLKFKGEFFGDSDLYIDGEAQGKIRLAKSKVTVGPNGRVQADVEAREIIVEGSLNGNLKASERVRLGSSSRVQGTLLSPRVAIDDGARLRGKVEMTRPPGTPGTGDAEHEADSESLPTVSARAREE
jgi:cytoskeletal protein CcmA (bactofilin family)